GFHDWQGLRRIVLVVAIERHQRWWMIVQRLLDRRDVRIAAYAEGRVVEPERVATLREKVELGVARHGEDRAVRRNPLANQVDQSRIAPPLVRIDPQAAERERRGTHGGH